MLKVIYLIQYFISTYAYLPAFVKYALAKTWPNETDYVTQRNTWHCEKFRDVAHTNVTQRNTLMKRDARKPATLRSENGTFRGEKTLRYDSKWHCEKLRDVAKITWRCAYKRDAAQYLNKTWHNETRRVTNAPITPVRALVTILVFVQIVRQRLCTERDKRKLILTWSY